MRSFAILVVGTLALSGAAYAQAPAAAPSKGYIEAVAQSAFGNVTSQSYGAEAGVTVTPSLQVFGEFGKVINAAPSSLGSDAQKIAGGVGGSFAVASAKEPITFGVFGVRYRIPSSGKVQPYVALGGGAAQVKKEVQFSNAGTDVTANVAQFGVILGTDLSGSETKAMLSVGAGIVWPVWQHVILDLGYRYGRVFTSDAGTNVSRAGAGIGIRF